MPSGVLTVDGPQAVSSARKYVCECCEQTQLDHLCDLAALLASELVTNAVRHARGRALVTVQPKGDRLRVVIADGSRALPEVSTKDPLSESGRGMMLVDALSRAWGVDFARDGKVVWFEV
jgi:anti-sigma regulatory factor (Ser/Thr protein kinase)